MCTKVYTPKGEIETVDDLRRLVYPHKIVINDGYNTSGLGRFCLCPVDVCATLKAAGIEYQWDNQLDIYTIEPRLPRS